jgi:flagellar hook protein FlgE
MGLASALSTALTGLTAAETTIDVVGNNLANSNTVGFKASTANFATQFLQTRSLGSGPTEGSGGTNPRQVGLGTMVADITPSFNQGTIEISSNPTDLAIQGDGFFIVQGQSGEHVYTRNGVFKLNSQSEMTTITGNRLLGYGIDDNFQIQTTSLTPLTIPLGAKSVAKPTENVYLEGTLAPNGIVADRAQSIQTGIMSDSQYTWPPNAVTATIAQPATNALAMAPAAGPGAIPAGNYYYKIVYADGPYGAANATEDLASAPSAVVTVPAGGAPSIQLSGWAVPVAPNNYSHVRFYRSTVNPADPTTATYSYVAESTMAGGPVNDTAAVVGAALNSAGIGSTAQFQYYVTFFDSTSNRESRPILMDTPLTVDAAQRLHLTNLPALPLAYAGQYNQTRIYRNLANDNTSFRRVTTINGVDGTATYTDRVTDLDLQDTVLHPPVDLDGPRITGSTLLQNIIRRDGATYSRVFEFPALTGGTLEFTGSKGGRTLATKNLAVTTASTILDLNTFMQSAMGIQIPPGPDPLNPIPQDANTGMNPGSYVSNGRIMFIGNNGIENAIGVGMSGMKMVTATGAATVNMPYSTAYTAAGESAVADFIAYDSLGMSVRVRLTAVLQGRNSTSTTYRWFADSADNMPASGVGIAVGTGLITFDGEGNLNTVTNDRVSIARDQVASASPLEFKLDFNNISGLASDKSTLAVSRQDGSPPGVLTSFIVGEDGRIQGVFSNGITRNLGQIRLARFANPAGLEQKGENLFGAGVNSGLPVEGNPNEQGIGSIISGAQELSNSDIGGNLIDLILASTMYRGNTRVISTATQMLDELLALRR